MLRKSAQAGCVLDLVVGLAAAAAYARIPPRPDGDQDTSAVKNPPGSTPRMDPRDTTDRCRPSATADSLTDDHRRWIAPRWTASSGIPIRASMASTAQDSRQGLPAKRRRRTSEDATDRTGHRLAGRTRNSARQPTRRVPTPPSTARVAESVCPACGCQRPLLQRPLQPGERAVALDALHQLPKRTTLDRTSRPWRSNHLSKRSSRVR